MNWKAKVRYAVPNSFFNYLLLKFPFLYRTNVVCFESGIQDKKGIEELLLQLGSVMDKKGDIIECGSSLCGTSVIMANFLRSRHSNKKVYACDSFEGLDKHELERERQAGLTSVLDNVFTAASYEYVAKKIKRLGVDGLVLLKKGFFQDTLPHIKSDFCFALIDCDLKDSIIYSAESIWPRLVSGGCMVFDDYNDQDFKGARYGIETFVDKYKCEFSEYGLMRRLYYARKK